MYVTAEMFAQASQEQEVKLATPLIDVIQASPAEIPLRRLVTSAGRLLAQDRNRHLASGLLKQGIYPSYAPSRILRRIINASIIPESSQPLAFDCTTDKIANACSDAEPAYARAFRDIYDGRVSGPSVELGGAVYVDDDLQAFAFGKSNGYASALALRDVTIKGVPYPAGSILYVAREDYTPGLSYGSAQSHFTLHHMSEITAINFTRLSAFASPPDQRDECHNEDTYIEAGDAAYNFLSTAQTGDLQPLVQTIVQANRHKLR